MIADRGVMAIVLPLRYRCLAYLRLLVLQTRMLWDCWLVNKMIMRRIWTARAQRNCRNGRIQCWFADTAKGKVCDFAFLTSSRGKFYMTVALAIPTLTVKNRSVRLIGHVPLIGQIRYLFLFQFWLHSRVFPIVVMCISDGKRNWYKHP